MVVDMGFTGGGWTGGAVTGVTTATGGFRVVTGGKGFVVGVTLWELGGRGVARFGGEGKDAGFIVYCRPRTLFEDEDKSGGVLGLVGDCVWGVVARSRGFW